jgi:hypothetical protein
MVNYSILTTTFNQVLGDAVQRMLLGGRNLWIKVTALHRATADPNATLSESRSA